MLAVTVALAGAVLAADAGAAPISIGGRVLVRAGEPLVGAVALLEGAGEEGAASPGQGSPRAATESGRSATSGRDGGFRLEAPGPGVWRVVLRAPGYAPAATDLQPLTEPVELPPLRLAPASALEVRVVAPDGRPVAGALVVAEPAPGRGAARRGPGTPVARAPEPPGPEPPWRPAPERLHTDEAGLATLSVQPAPGTVMVAAEGHAHQRISLGTAEAPAGGGPAVLALEAGREHSVAAHDAEGRPVPSVRVLLEGLGPVGTTGAAGRLDFIAPAGAGVRLVAPDGRWAAGELEPPGRPSTDLVLQPPGRWRGTITDGATGAPLAGAVVFSTLHPGGAALSDRIGRFTLDLPFSPGSRLGVSRAGYLPVFVEVDLGRPEEIAVELRPASALSGRVVDERSAPIDGAELHLAPAGLPDPAPGVGRWARSAIGGAYRIAGLPPGAAGWLRASAPGFAPVRREVAVPEASREADVRVVLRRGRRSAGRVLDGGSGEPVTDARVIGVPASFADDVDSLLTAGETAVEAVTRADGRFELPLLPPGEIDLVVTSTAHVPRRLRAQPLPAGEGTAELGPIHLQRAVSIAGQAVDPDGSLVDGCTVHRVDEGPASLAMLLTPDRAGPAAHCGLDGSFTLGGLEPGREVRFRVARAGFLPAVAAATPGETAEPLRVELRPEVRISGRVEDEVGTPVAGAVVIAGRPGEDGNLDSAGRVGRADAEGRFELTGLDAGRLEIHALAPGYLGGRTAVDVRAGEPVEGLRIVLELGAVIAGTVVDPAGEPVAGAQVGILDNGRPAALATIERPVARSDAEGAFELIGIAPGRRTLAAEHPAFQPGRYELEVTPEENRVTLRLESGLAVEGTVVDDAGLPAPGADVALGGLAGAIGARRQTTGADGSFRFQGLVPGSYRAVAERTGLTSDPADGTVELTDRPATRLILRLAPGAALSGRIVGVPLHLLDDAQVAANTLGRAGRRGRVDGAGGYRVAGLAPGEWTVTALVPALGREVRGRVRIEPGQIEAILDLELPAGFTLSGTVVRGGVPVPGAMVVASGADSSGGALAGEDGRFAIPGLATGAFVVTALASGRGQSHQAVQLTGDLDVVLPLEPSEGTAGIPGDR